MKTDRLVKLALLSIIFVLGFGSSSWGKEKPITIKLSEHIPALEEVGAWAGDLYFKNKVEERSRGRLKVELFPSNQLGSERESIESMKMGLHQMDDVTGAAITNFIPEFQVFYIPYVFRNRAVSMQVLSLDNPFMKELCDKAAAKTNIRVLAWGENGPRNMLTKNKMVKTPADLKGQKIRIMESPVLGIFMKSLGANPTPISWGELYTSMQQGVVDGMDQVVNLIDVGKFAEVASYVSMTYHVYDPVFYIINEKFYQGLPEDLRQIVKEAAYEQHYISTGIMMYWNDVASLRNIQKQDVEIYYPTDEEREAFKQISQPKVIEYLRKDIGDEVVDKFMKAVDEAEAKLKGK